MKKIITFALCALLIGSLLVACGGNGDEGETLETKDSIADPYVDDAEFPALQ